MTVNNAFRLKYSVKPKDLLIKNQIMILLVEDAVMDSWGTDSILPLQVHYLSHKKVYCNLVALNCYYDRDQLTIVYAYFHSAFRDGFIGRKCERTCIHNVCTRTMEENACSYVNVAKQCVMYQLDVSKVRISLYFFLLVIGRMFQERKRRCLKFMEKTTT